MLLRLSDILNRMSEKPLHDSRQDTRQPQDAKMIHDQVPGCQTTTWFKTRHKTPSRCKDYTWPGARMPNHYMIQGKTQDNLKMQRWYMTRCQTPNHYMIQDKTQDTLKMQRWPKQDATRCKDRHPHIWTWLCLVMMYVVWCLVVCKIHY